MFTLSNVIRYCQIMKERERTCLFFKFCNHLFRFWVPKFSLAEQKDFGRFSSLFLPLFNLRKQFPFFTLRCLPFSLGILPGFHGRLGINLPSIGIFRIQEFVDFCLQLVLILCQLYFCFFWSCVFFLHVSLGGLSFHIVTLFHCF